MTWVTFAHVTGSVEYESPEDAFGAAVRRSRERKGWSQEALAARLADAGINVGGQSGVARIEKGQRPTRLNEAVAIAQFLEINLTRVYASRGMGPTLEDYGTVDTPSLLEGKRQLETHINRTSHDVAVAMVSVRQQREALQVSEERLRELETLHSHFHRQLFDIREALQSRGIEMDDHAAEMAKRFPDSDPPKRKLLRRKPRDGE
jgi:transcriptional regulator with XRE-family HTH domain